MVFLEMYKEFILDPKDATQFKQSDHIPEEQRTTLLGVEIKFHINPCNMVTTHSAVVLPGELLNESVNDYSRSSIESED